MHNTENGQFCQHKVRNAFTEHFCHLFSNEQAALKSLYNGAKVHLARLFNTQDENRSSKQVMLVNLPRERKVHFNYT